jgi:hypothetical protein
LSIKKIKIESGISNVNKRSKNKRISGRHQARLKVFVALDDTETIVMTETSADDSWEEDEMEGVSK